MAVVTPALFADDSCSPRRIDEFDLYLILIFAAIPGAYSVGGCTFGMKTCFLPEFYSAASAVALFIARLLYCFSSLALITRFCRPYIGGLLLELVS